MPLHYERDDTQQLIRITAEGTASPEEWMAGPQRQATEGCWHYPLLFDIRNAESTGGCGPTLWDTTALGQELTKQHGQRGRGASVGAHGLAPATARMYTITTNTMFTAIQVFKALDEAEAWLATQPRKHRSPNP